MTLTPDDVSNQRFKEKRKGYDVDEVDAFLERVMQALAELIDERDRLRRTLEERGGEDPDTLLARTLVTAQRAADETVAAAQAEASRLLDEAQQRTEGERSALEAESTRVARAAESLVRFRSEYRTRVQAVIAEQLALLDRAGELPDVPQAVRDLAAFGGERVDARAAAEPTPLASSVLGDHDDDASSARADLAAAAGMPDRSPPGSALGDDEQGRSGTG
jgi:DivIVA domain-containing protein